MRHRFPNNSIKHIMTGIFSKLEAFWCRPPVYWLLIPLLAAATPLTFAPYYHFWLMPLLFAAFIRLLELRPDVRTRSAYLFGLVAYTPFYWIHTALHDVSGLPNLYALPLTMLLPAYLALFPATAVWLWNRIRLNRWLHTGLALPVFWTLMEFARERLLTGFGWGALGYSQIADHAPLAGFAPFGRHSFGYIRHRVTRCMAGFTGEQQRPSEKTLGPCLRRCGIIIRRPYRQANRFHPTHRTNRHRRPGSRQYRTTLKNSATTKSCRLWIVISDKLPPRMPISSSCPKRHSP